MVYSSQDRFPLSSLSPSGKQFDTQVAARRAHENTMATPPIAQLQTRSAWPPCWVGHRAGAWNTADFPGTKMEHGNGVGFAEIMRVASRKLRMKAGPGTKTISRKQQIPQGLDRLRVRSLRPPMSSHFLPPNAIMSGLGFQHTNFGGTQIVNP